MPNKNYQKGRRFEYRVKKHLENKGYFVVRSAGSKSPFDLIAIPKFASDNTEILLIQCKYGAKISKKERDKLIKLYWYMPSNIQIQVAWAEPNKPIIFQNVNGEHYGKRSKNK